MTLESQLWVASMARTVGRVRWPKSVTKVADTKSVMSHIALCTRELLTVVVGAEDETMYKVETT
jgi:hypothetical protein